ncbi:MAG: fibronectin type III domain-containing protein [bacterium]|nr:fibronectin type III domain-containing protein [bacterium]
MNKKVILISISSILYLGIANGEPTNIHATLSNDPTTITITWRTDLSVSTGIVEYGLISPYDSSVNSITHTYDDNTIHDATITGLDSGKTYHYRCGNDSDGWSDDRTFTTLMGDSFKFCVFADSQGDSGNVHYERYKRIVELIDNERPDLVICAGDIIRGSPRQEQWEWDEFFSASTFLKYSLFMPVMGNHERPDPSFFHNQFSLPERWYSFDYGNAHFIGISYLSRETADWLKEDLANTTKQWKFVYIHEPAFTVCPEKHPNLKIRSWLGPHFDQYKVDMVFCGHAHNYERSYPIQHRGPEFVIKDSYNDGVCYVVSGGAGGTLYDSGIPSESSGIKVAINKHHFICININGKTLDFKAIDIDGNIIDSFTISRPEVPAPVVSSPTHPDEALWYANGNGTVKWTIDHPDIDGYSYLWDQNGDTIPDEAKDCEEDVTSLEFSLSDGIWYFHIKAKDNAGNWGSVDHYRVQVDTSPPPAPVITSSTHPDQNNWYSNNDPVFNFSTSDVSGIAGYSYVLDQAQDTIPDNESEGIDTTVPYTDVADGVHWFHVKAKNGAGLWGDTSHYKIKVDVTPPDAVTIDYPVDNYWYVKPITTYYGKASDSTSGIDLSTLEYSYNNGSWTSFTDDTGIHDWDDSDEIPHTIETPGVPLQVRVKDNAIPGNLATSQVITIKVDTSVPIPVVSSTTHPDEDTWYSKDDLRVEWTPGADTSGIDGYSYILDQISDTTPDTEKECEEDTTSATFTDLSDGTWYFHIKAKDNAGNWSSAYHYRVNVDVTPPVASIILSPSDTSSSVKVKTGKIKVTLTASEELSETPTLSYKPNGKEPIQIELSGSGKEWKGVMYVNSTTPEGEATFNWEGKDLAGNTGTEIIEGASFKIDKTIDPTLGGTVSEFIEVNGEMLEVKVEIGSGVLPLNTSITIGVPDPDSPDIVKANNNTAFSIIPIPGVNTTYTLTASDDSNGNSITEFNGFVNIVIPYPDSDQNGIVDETEIDEDTLCIFCLDKETKTWNPVENSEVDSKANFVTAKVKCLSTFSIMSSVSLNIVDNIIHYPNPYYPDEKEEPLRIINIPPNSNAVVYIYNIGGKLIKTLEEGNGIEEVAGNGMAKWYAKNDQGEDVAYGIYIYVVKCDKGIKKGKIAIIR